MPIDVEDVESSYSRKLFTGYAPVQIFAVNPTVSGLAKIFKKPEEDVKDPAYDKTEGKMRLDFWYRNHPNFDTELQGKFSIWISNDSMVGKESGKTQYIDHFTKTAWAKDKESLIEQQKEKDPSYRLDLKNTRIAKIGEEELYEILKAYVNARPQTKPFVLDSFENLTKGRVSELNKFFSDANEKGQGIKIPLTIREGQYQNVFTKGIVGLNTPINDYIKKRFAGQYGCKDFYGSSFVFKEFTDAVPQDIGLGGDETPFDDGGKDIPDLF